MTIRTGPSDRKLLNNLYNRTCAVMNGEDTEAQAEFGRMAAEYFAETMHQSFPGYDGYRAQMTVRRCFADAERVFAFDDWCEDQHGPESDQDDKIEHALIP
jgi:hypothetical protein